MMEYTYSERIAIALFNKHIYETIKEGSLSEEIYNLRIYFLCQKVLLVYIYIFDTFGPFTYQDIKELAAMTYFSLISIVDNRSDCATKADNMWGKYEKRFERYMALRNDLIKYGYLKFEFNNTRLDIGNGIVVPLSREAFMEGYNALYPVTFPNSFNDYIKAIQKIAKSLQSDIIPNELETRHKSLPKINYRRPVALCVCLLYKAEKYDISKMSKKGLEQFIKDNFKDEKTGKTIASAQRVVNTLFGYDLRFSNEKAMLSYRNEKWVFNEDNFNYMHETFPDDYKKALLLMNKFK